MPTSRTLRRPLAAVLAALTMSAAFAAMSQSSQAAAQQEATISILPGIVQPGRKTANADKALAAARKSVELRPDSGGAAQRSETLGRAPRVSSGSINAEVRDNSSGARIDMVQPVDPRRE